TATWNCRPGRTGRHRSGHRLDATRAAEPTDDPSRRSRGREDQHVGDSPAGRADRTHLRSQRPHQLDHQYRPVQLGVRHDSRFFVQWIFLGDLRSAIIVSSTIPFALFFAIGILVMRGESANLLSVGAIDFGPSSMPPLSWWKTSFDTLRKA